MVASHGSLHWVSMTIYALLPFIKESMALSYTQAGFLISVIHTSAFLTSMPSGVLVDLTDRRVACQFMALAVAGLALGLVGVTSGYWMLATLIALIAAMNTLWHPAAVSYLSNTYPGRRGLAISFHTVGSKLGDAGAPLFVGAAVAGLGWQNTAMAGASLPLVSALFILVFLLGAERRHRETAGRHKGRDYLKGLLQVLANGSIWKLCLLSGFRSTTQSGLRTFLPLYLVGALAVEPLVMGLVLMLYQGAGAVTSPIVGTLSDRFGRKPVLLIGFSVTTLAVLAMPASLNLWVFAAIVILCGVFLFAIQPVVQSWAMDIAPPRLGGTVIGLQFSTQSVFSILVPVIGGLIADNWGIGFVFYMLAGAVLFGGLIAASVRD
jgi:MFS family permease